MSSSLQFHETYETSVIFLVDHLMNQVTHQERTQNCEGLSALIFPVFYPAALTIIPLSVCG